MGQSPSKDKKVERGAMAKSSNDQQKNEQPPAATVEEQQQQAAKGAPKVEAPAATEPVSDPETTKEVEPMEVEKETAPAVDEEVADEKPSGVLAEAETAKVEQAFEQSNMEGEATVAPMEAENQQDSVGQGDEKGDDNVGEESPTKEDEPMEVDKPDEKESKDTDENAGGGVAAIAATETSQEEPMEVEEQQEKASSSTAADADEKKDMEVEKQGETNETKGNENEDGNKNDDNDDDGDDISSSSSTTTTDTGDNDDIITTEKANEKLVRAAQFKEEGNTHFKEQKLDQAARAYRRGCNALKPLRSNPAHADDTQVTSLLVALQANLSMVCFKQKKMSQCIQIATMALSVDATNVKVLYRRALAQRQTGHLTEARADLRTALQHDPNNKACKKELVAIKQELERTNAKQKKALAKAFGAGSSLYGDKQAAEQKREQAALEKKQREQELYKKRKDEWEDECVSRMARNEPAVSFEDWVKELEEEEKKKQKEEEERKKEQMKVIQEERKKAKELERQQRLEQKKLEGKKDDDSDDDDDEELTKEELAMMRGYKKTSDGRTTSYFNRELSEDAKRAIGDIAPKRLDVTPTATTAAAAVVSSGPTLLKKSSNEGASAWNKAGTWEEKDTTGWCSDELTKRLQATVAKADNLDAMITSVDELTGHASVALTGGKRRYIFDFHSKLKYEIKTTPEPAPAEGEGGEDDENNQNVTKPVVVAKGVVRLPDICSTDHEELEVTFESWKKTPAVDMEAQILEMRKVLAEELRATVKLWVQAFNEQY